MSCTLSTEYCSDDQERILINGMLASGKMISCSHSIFSLFTQQTTLNFHFLVQSVCRNQSSDQLLLTDCLGNVAEVLDQIKGNSQFVVTAYYIQLTAQSSIHISLSSSCNHTHTTNNFLFIQYSVYPIWIHFWFHHLDFVVNPRIKAVQAKNFRVRVGRGRERKITRPIK